MTAEQKHAAKEIVQIGKRMDILTKRAQKILGIVQNNLLDGNINPDILKRKALRLIARMEPEVEVLHSRFVQLKKLFLIN